MAEAGFDEIGLTVLNKYVQIRKIKHIKSVKLAEEKVRFVQVFDIIFSDLSNGSSTS